jgi:hypothetical protein
MIIMKNENRTNKQGKKLVAAVKTYFITVKEDIQTGKLINKSESAKYCTGIKFDKVVKAGEKICIRIAFKQVTGKTLVYLHRNGWALVDDLNEAFNYSKGEIKDDIYSGTYEALTIEEKALVAKEMGEKEPTLREVALEKLGTLTKTEEMLLAFLEGKDLAEVEKEIIVDKSLKYKIKKNADKYKEALMKKLA